jgi:hypothetical protein
MRTGRTPSYVEERTLLNCYLGVCVSSWEFIVLSASKANWSVIVTTKRPGREILHIADTSWTRYRSVRCIKCDQRLALCISNGRMLMKICLKCRYRCFVTGNTYMYFPAMKSLRDVVSSAYTVNVDGTINDMVVQM